VIVFCYCCWLNFTLLQNPTPAEFFDVLHAAEKATWPSISRIRAHCLTEVTLDKCVQKLRKRITDESERQSAAIANAFQDAAAKGKLDRTPSFYTSRSIVNLSGLSIADPVPRNVRKHSVRLGELNTFVVLTCFVCVCVCVDVFIRLFVYHIHCFYNCTYSCFLVPFCCRIDTGVASIP
jgi:hypothetical protein